MQKKRNYSNSFSQKVQLWQNHSWGHMTYPFHCASLHLWCLTLPLFMGTRPQPHNYQIMHWSPLITIELCYWKSNHIKILNSSSRTNKKHTWHRIIRHIIIATVSFYPSLQHYPYVRTSLKGGSHVRHFQFSLLQRSSLAHSLSHLPTLILSWCLYTLLIYFKNH